MFLYKCIGIFYKGGYFAHKSRRTDTVLFISMPLEAQLKIHIGNARFRNCLILFKANLLIEKSSLMWKKKLRRKKFFLE